MTTRDISSAVVAAGVTIDRRQVQLDSPIKTIGMHPVRVVLHPEVSVEVIVNVARSTEEAEMQARGERINRDGELVNIDEENNDVAADKMFEEAAAPDAAADVISEEAHGVAGNDTAGEHIS